MGDAFRRDDQDDLKRERGGEQEVTGKETVEKERERDGEKGHLQNDPKGVMFLNRTKRKGREGDVVGLCGGKAMREYETPGRGMPCCSDRKARCSKAPTRFPLLRCPTPKQLVISVD
jgi:hypothetical protein